MNIFTHVTHMRNVHNECYMSAYILGRFTTIYYKSDKFCDFWFAFLHTKTLLKKGSKFFGLRVDAFFRKEAKILWQSCSPESVSLPLKFVEFVIKTLVLPNKLRCHAYF